MNASARANFPLPSGEGLLARKRERGEGA